MSFNRIRIRSSCLYTLDRMTHLMGRIPEASEWIIKVNISDGYHKFTISKIIFHFFRSGSTDGVWGQSVNISNGE